MFASSIAQVPFMLFSNKLSRIPAFSRLSMATVMYLLSMVCIAMVKSPELVILCCALNGIGFGLQLPSIRQLVFENSPKEFHNTAQGLGDAINSSFAGMMSSSLAGVIIDAYGVKEMLLASAVMQLIAVVLLFGRFIIVKSNGKSVEISPH